MASALKEELSYTLLAELSEVCELDSRQISAHSAALFNGESGTRRGRRVPDDGRALICSVS